MYALIVIALVALGIPPILTNAYVSVEGIDRDVVETTHGRVDESAVLAEDDRVETPERREALFPE